MINNRPLTMVGSDPEDLELQLLHYRLCLGDPLAIYGTKIVKARTLLSPRLVCGPDDRR